MSLNLSYDFECNVINACKQGDLALSEGDCCSNNSDYCYKTRGCYKNMLLPENRIQAIQEEIAGFLLTEVVADKGEYHAK